MARSLSSSRSMENPNTEDEQGHSSDLSGTEAPQNVVKTKLRDDEVEVLEEALEVLRPCPTPGLIRLLRSHCSSTARLRSRITYSGHGRADMPPLSTTLGLSSVRSLPHLAVYPALM